MAKPLPIKLGKEPLIEAVCELWVTTSQPLHTVLPGLMLAQFSADIGKTAALPASQLPEEIRSRLEQLARAPLVGIEWRGLKVLVGERQLAVSCGKNYPGWSEFRRAIADLFQYLLKLGFIQKVERYSLKYVNLFEISKPEFLNKLDLSLGGEGVIAKANITSLRMDKVDGDILTIVNITTPATVLTENFAQLVGSIVDVDAIFNSGAIATEQFRENMLERLDSIRRVNKQAFFDSFTPEAIKAMEPTYD